MATTAPGTTRTAPARRTRAMRLPRTTGALSGALIVLLGLWGGLIPFVGPYFHYAFGGYHTWHYTSQRLWLDIVPGAVAVVGGLMLLRASTRVGGLTAGWVALAAGAWFAVGPVVSLLWHHSIYAIGAPAGSYTRQMLEWVGYFFGLGAVIIGLAAFAMGRYFSRPRIVEEPIVAAEAATAEAPVLAGRRRTAAAGTGAAVADRTATAGTGAAVADRTPASGTGAAVADRRAAEADALERPRAGRANYGEGTARADEPAADARVADAPATRAGAADVPAESTAPVADAPAGGSARGAEGTGAGAAPGAGPIAAGDPAEVAAPSTGTASATGTGAAPTATTYRRRPGLLRRLRGD